MEICFGRHVRIACTIIFFFIFQFFPPFNRISFVLFSLPNSHHHIEATVQWYICVLLFFSSYSVLLYFPFIRLPTTSFFFFRQMRIRFKRRRQMYTENFRRYEKDDNDLDNLINVILCNTNSAPHRHTYIVYVHHSKITNKPNKQPNIYVCISHMQYKLKHQALAVSMGIERILKEHTCEHKWNCGTYKPPPKSIRYRHRRSKV